MKTLRAKFIVESLHAAGVTIAPTIDGKLRATPASQLTPELSGMIREKKAELLRYFSGLAAYDPKTEPPADPNAWRELAQAYHAHHFSCQACIAAGRASGYGQRCGAGMALWRAYCD